MRHTGLFMRLGLILLTQNPDAFPPRSDVIYGRSHRFYIKIIQMKKVLLII